MIALLFGLAVPASSTSTDSADREAILEAREEAILDTLLNLEDQVEQFGGLGAMYDAIQPLNTECLERFGGPIVARTVTVGGNRYNTFTPLALQEFRAEDVGDGDPVRVIIDFHEKLQQQGIDLIAVPVPAKIELCVQEDYDHPPANGSAVSPGRIEAMLELLEAGVEVVDVLPMLEEAEPDAEVPLYELHGHHLSGLGARLAGELVAERLDRYEFSDCDPLRFEEIRRTSTERVDRNVPMKAWQVLDSDSNPYEHVESAQVIVIGDSHAFAYFTASWASHIARTAGLAISDISESSGGGSAHSKLARRGLEDLQRRRVVIWIFTGAMVLSERSWLATPLHEEPVAEEDGIAAQVRQQLNQYYETKKTDPESVDLAEDEINNLGYRLLRGRLTELAVEVFKIGTVEYPESANAHDSLGEAYAAAGERELAIEALRRALSLSPEPNTLQNARKLLRELGADESPDAGG
jgi:tetratricopeptide (TPR) repeat protein